MSSDKIDYDKIVKDHLRMRLMESGWTDKLSKLIQDAITKRLENGQMPNNIKFEQLYSDITDDARDAISNNLENEFHLKVGEYLSLTQHENNKTSNLPAVNPPAFPSEVPSDVISNDNTWMEPQCSYYE